MLKTQKITSFRNHFGSGADQQNKMNIFWIIIPHRLFSICNLFLRRQYAFRLLLVSGSSQSCNSITKSFPKHRWLQNDYISSSRTLKSVSVSASVAVINSQTIRVCICNLIKHLMTDLATDFGYRHPEWASGFGRGSSNHYESHVCNR